jgi:acyl-CoA synthetase (NDP forming)
MDELNRIFYPSSVAIIGASKERKFGRMFLESFVDMGFEGRLYPVNPHEKEILGLKAYPSVKEIPSPVDLAIVATSPQVAPQVVRECAEKGVKGVVIYTAGFSEMGEEGKKIEEEMVRIARAKGTRIIGPNCQGIYCPSSKLTIFPGLPKESGNVGFISQSGSLATMLVLVGDLKGIRFSKVVSFGNGCDLNIADFLEYLWRDPETKIITAYMEGIKDGWKFLKLAREASKTKPIIVWRGGVTEAGAKAAASHTGAMAVPNAMWKAFSRQCGIINTNSVEELFDCLLAFMRLPIPKGRKVAVISGPGGPAVTAADACVEMGLELAQLSEETRRIIGGLIPPVGTSTRNPVDLGMGTVFAPEFYREAVRIVGGEENVDMLLVICFSPDAVDMVLEAEKDLEKPVVIALPAITELREYKLSSDVVILAYPSERRAARVLGALADYKEFLEKQSAH